MGSERAKIAKKSDKSIRLGTHLVLNPCGVEIDREAFCICHFDDVTMTSSKYLFSTFLI